MPGPETRPGPTSRLALSQFVQGLAQATGLDPKVVAAWVDAEGAYSASGTGGFNFLNVRAKGARGYSGVPIPTTSSGGFAQFYSVGDAVQETAYWINQMPNYATIRSATHLRPRSQLAAIAASPWDTGHYGGGRKLYDAYASIIKPGGHWLGIDWGKVNTYFDPGGGAGLPDPAKPVIQAGKTVQSSAEAVGNAASFAFNPTNWLRIGYILGGGVMVLLGAVLLAKSVGALNVSGPAAPVLDLGGGKPGDGQGPIAGQSRTAQRRAGFKSNVPPRRPKRGEPGSTKLAPGDTIPF